jgi:hypothetical protein
MCHFITLASEAIIKDLTQHTLTANVILYDCSTRMKYNGDLLSYLCENFEQEYLFNMTNFEALV